MNNHARQLGVTTGLLVVCALFALNGPSVQGQAPSLETIAKAWRDRQDRVRSARFEWTERETLTKGYLTNIVTEPFRLKYMGIDPGSVVPPDDVTHDVKASMLLDGEKLRSTRDDRQWDAKIKSLRRGATRERLRRKSG